jgi:predicted nuclease with TOPRIM domain
MANLGSVDLAEIRARYVENRERLPAHVYADMDALWNEAARLQFEVAGLEGRAERILEENAKLESRMYVLLSRMPGAGMAV